MPRMIPSKEEHRDDSEICCVAVGPKDTSKGHGDQEQAAVSQGRYRLVLKRLRFFFSQFSYTGGVMRWCTGAALQRWIVEKRSTVSPAAGPRARLLGGHRCRPRSLRSVGRQWWQLTP